MFDPFLERFLSEFLEKNNFDLNPSISVALTEARKLAPFSTLQMKISLAFIYIFQCYLTDPKLQ